MKLGSDDLRDYLGNDRITDYIYLGRLFVAIPYGQCQGLKDEGTRSTEAN